MPPRFEWDPRKAVGNRTKHKISFDEAVTVFRDPLGRITRDPRHVEGEERFVLLGRSLRGRSLVVLFVERGDVIRIISTREATRRERRSYEEGED